MLILQPGVQPVHIVVGSSPTGPGAPATTRQDCDTNLVGDTTRLGERWEWRRSRKLVLSNARECEPGPVGRRDRPPSSKFCSSWGRRRRPIDGLSRRGSRGGRCQVEQGGGVLVDAEDGGVIGELGVQRRQAPLVHVAVAGVVGAALVVVVVRDEPNRPWAADQCIDRQVGCYRVIAVGLGCCRLHRRASGS
jgi:hypothetical protein